MDCTTIGCALPTGTSPTHVVTVCLRVANVTGRLAGSIIRPGRGMPFPIRAKDTRRRPRQERNNEPGAHALCIPVGIIEAAAVVCLASHQAECPVSEDIDGH